MKAKVARDLEFTSRSGYPSPFAERVLPREVRALGAPFGLKHVGVNLVTIFPGKESSIRHCHTHEDEFVYVLEGELVLRTNAGEETMTAGMIAGFPAGDGDGHHFVNRSQAPARFLVVSNRDPNDGADYPDDDLTVEKDASGKYVFGKKSDKKR